MAGQADGNGVPLAGKSEAQTYGDILREARQQLGHMPETGERFTIKGREGIWAFMACTRCGGTGRYSFNLMDMDKCYGCWYTPTLGQLMQVEGKIARRREQDRARRERKRQAQVEEAQQAAQAALEADPELAQAIAYGREVDQGFIQDVAAKLDRYGSISQAQRDAVVKAAAGHRRFQAQKAADEAAKQPVPTGQGITIEGDVVKVEWKETAYGSRHVMVVKGDGWAVWGSVPSSLDEVDRGDRVRFVANVEASDKDQSFGFFKRPRKAELLTEGAC